MKGRLAALVALATLAVAGCSGPAKAPTLRELASGASVDAFADPEALERAEAAGRLRRLPEAREKAGGRPVTIVASAPNEGEVRELSVICERGQSDKRVRLTPLAVKALPRDRNADADQFLKEAGLERRALVGFAPVERAAIYETSREQVFVAIGPGESGSAPRLAMLYRGDQAILLDLAGVKRWKAVENRLKQAVAVGATLEQVRDEVGFVALIPYAEERAAAEPLVRAFQGELDKRVVAVEGAWHGASLEERCALLREAQDLLGASKPAPERFVSLEKRLRDELCAQLDREVAQADAASAPHTAAGWLLARARLASDASALARAKKLLEASLDANVPALQGAEMSLVEPLYEGGLLLGEKAPVTALAGVKTGTRGEHARRATVPPGTLEVSAREDTLEEHTTRENRVHDFTRVNPAWVVWREDHARIEADMAANDAVMSANAGYEKSEQTINLNIIKTTTNLDMKARYEAAEQRGQGLKQNLAAHKSAEPRPRIPAQATYPVDVQTWSGKIQRRVQLTIQHEKIELVQDYAVGSNGDRTAGSQASDLASENIPPSDTWRAREAHVAAAGVVFAKGLAGALLPRLRSLLDRRVVASLERVKDPGVRLSEERWARYLLGLDQATADRDRCARALGGS